MPFDWAHVVSDGFVRDERLLEEGGRARVVVAAPNAVRTMERRCILRMC